ncbi:MAG: ABC transporter ATP-binding protein [Ignavibacteriales bacterium CG_4_9_14_3_um_filter_30_11]|nr:MAG: ABC transporter ATP-binding protein [Ignavibacteriales bacterium CG_4_9_14_3_um_filter_30_11]
MNNYHLAAEQITKKFGRRLIFSDLNFQFQKNGIYGITGINGSGKSTLIKIIAGIISPSSGKVIHQFKNEIIDSTNLHNNIGFVAPYLIMYEEFSAWENLKHISKIRGIKFNTELFNSLMDDFLLLDRKDDLIKTYSSGMKQRFKFIFALMHTPKILLLDEPTSNLDDAGKESVYKIIKREGQDKIVIIASNEKSDLDLCNTKLELQDFKL